MRKQTFKLKTKLYSLKTKIKALKVFRYYFLILSLQSYPHFFYKKDCIRVPIAR